MSERHTPTDRRTDRKAKPTDTDASSGWREEYAHQGAHGADPHDGDPPRGTETPPRERWPAPRRQLVADGGAQARRLPHVGERVTDREADADGEAVVTAVHPDTPAAEAYVDALEETVADVNPGYDPAAPVADVAFRDDLEAAGVAVDALLEDLRALEDLAITVRQADVSTYTYPAPRLEPVGDPPDAVEEYRHREREREQHDADRHRRGVDS